MCRLTGSVCVCVCLHGIRVHTPGLWVCDCGQAPCTVPAHALVDTAQVYS